MPFSGFKPGSSANPGSRPASFMSQSREMAETVKHNLHGLSKNVSSLSSAGLAKMHMSINSPITESAPPSCPTAGSSSRPRELMKNIRSWTWANPSRRRSKTGSDVSSRIDQPIAEDDGPASTHQAGLNRMSGVSFFSRLSRTQSRLHTDRSVRSATGSTSTGQKRMSGSRNQVRSLFLPPSNQAGPTADRTSAPADSQVELAPVRLWAGSGAFLEYGGLHDDVDLWMPSGDCMITTVGLDGRPRRTFRLHSAVLAQAGSPLLARIVRMARMRPSFSSRPGSSSMDDPAGLEIEQDLVDMPESDPLDPEITHEIPFQTLVQPLELALAGASPVPGRDAHMSEERQELAVRNMLALLYDKPLAGRDLFEILTDLQRLLDCFFVSLSSRSELSRRLDSVCVDSTTAMVVAHVASRNLDDVRNSLDRALDLLAWSEQATIRWGAGFIEAFVHAVGMMTEDALDRPAFRRLTRATRYQVENGYIAIQLHLLAAADRLVGFEAADLVPAERAGDDGAAAVAAANRFSAFLCSFYANELGEWPPVSHAGNTDSAAGLRANPGRWLSRSLALRLQADFGVLFDYLADRDVVWDDQSGFMSVNNCALVDCPVTFAGRSLAGLLGEWDSRHGLDHIPHPFPLLPEPNAVVESSTIASRPRRTASTLFPLRSLRNRPPSSPRQSKRERLQSTLALGEASNIGRHSAALPENRLLDAFVSFERTDPADDLQAARVGRWLVLYAILQALSTVAVDVSPIRHDAGVDYFLSAPLSACPTWARSDLDCPLLAATQQRSHCWTRARHWATGRLAGLGSVVTSPTSNSIPEECEQDGAVPVKTRSRPVVDSFGLFGSVSGTGSATNSPTCLSPKAARRSRSDSVASVPKANRGSEYVFFTDPFAPSAPASGSGSGSFGPGIGPSYDFSAHHSSPDAGSVDPDDDYLSALSDLEEIALDLEMQYQAAGEAAVFARSVRKRRRPKKRQGRPESVLLTSVPATADDGLAARPRPRIPSAAPTEEMTFLKMSSISSSSQSERPPSASVGIRVHNNVIRKSGDVAELRHPSVVNGWTPTFLDTDGCADEDGGDHRPPGDDQIPIPGLSPKVYEKAGQSSRLISPECDRTDRKMSRGSSVWILGS